MAIIRQDRGAVIKTLLKIILIMALCSVAVIFALSYIAFDNAKRSSEGSVGMDMENATYTQLDGPTENQEIAIFTTSVGEFRVALYRDFAPNTVEYFVNSAKAGKYDGTRIILGSDGVYSIAGGEEYDGTAMEHEINENLWTFKGAVCAITDNTDSTDVGSRLLFVNHYEFTDTELEQLGTLATNYGGEDIIRKYIDNGGVLNFAGQFTTFGQVYEGMEVYEQLSGIRFNAETSEAEEEIIIEKVEISTYKK